MRCGVSVGRQRRTDDAPSSSSRTVRTRFRATMTTQPSKDAPFMLRCFALGLCPQPHPRRDPPAKKRLDMPRILFVSGFHPSTRARDLAYEFERCVHSARSFFPKNLHAIRLARQLWATRTLRRAGTTQSTRQFQPVSVFLKFTSTPCPMQSTHALHERDLAVPSLSQQHTNASET